MEMIKTEGCFELQIEKGITERKNHSEEMKPHTMSVDLDSQIE
jgi:hypothetical protein